MKRSRRSCAAAASIVLGILALVAPGGSAAVAAPTLERLAIMVLPKSAYGPEANRFEVDIGSGVVDNDAAVETTLDPDDTAAQLGRDGRILGYDVSYSDVSLMPLVGGVSGGACGGGRARSPPRRTRTSSARGRG